MSGNDEGRKRRRPDFESISVPAKVWCQITFYVIIIDSAHKGCSCSNLYLFQSYLSNLFIKFMCNNFVVSLGRIHIKRKKEKGKRTKKATNARTN